MTMLKDSGLKNSGLKDSGFSADAPLMLIGCGKMGSALLDGWLSGGLLGEAIVISEPQPSEALSALAAEKGITLIDDPAQVQATPRAIMAAIKPQMMEAVMPAIGARFGGASLWLSIAAGTPVSFFEGVGGEGARVVRIMPNTPSAVGKGVSALIANGAARADDKAIAEALLNAVGTTVWLENEAQMDAVTGVSGSGPAYIFHMIEALTAAAEAEGLAPDLALALAHQTVVGAAALADASEDSAATLRANVTSPGGTTAAGLAVLMDGEKGLPAIMKATVAAAANRSRELG